MGHAVASPDGVIRAELPVPVSGPPCPVPLLFSDPLRRTGACLQSSPYCKKPPFPVIPILPRHQWCFCARAPPTIGFLCAPSRLSCLPPGSPLTLRLRPITPINAGVRGYQGQKGTPLAQHQTWSWKRTSRQDKGPEDDGHLQFPFMRRALGTGGLGSWDPPQGLWNPRGRRCAVDSPGSRGLERLTSR